MKFFEQPLQVDTKTITILRELIHVDICGTLLSKKKIIKNSITDQLEKNFERIYKYSFLKLMISAMLIFSDALYKT